MIVLKDKFVLRLEIIEKALILGLCSSYGFFKDFVEDKVKLNNVLEGLVRQDLVLWS